MKRIPALVLALAMLAALMAPGAAYGAEKKVYAFDRKFFPFSFVRNQTPTGFEVEILEAALEGLGLGIEYKPMRSWERGQAELSSGVVHIASGMTRTELKDKLFIFPTTPTVDLNLKFFVNKSSLFKSVEELRGLTIAAKRDSVNQLLLQEFGGIKVRLYENDEQALEATRLGDAAAYFGADKIAWDIIDRKDMRNIVVLGPTFRTVPLYYALYKGEGDLREIVDRGLRRIMANGEYDRIYRKWFVPELTRDAMTAMVKHAQSALPTAHVPRTGKAYAAVVTTRSGNMYTGSTVEGLRGGVGMSAMEIAVAKAVGVGDLEIHAAAVVAANGRVMPPTAPDRELLAGFGRGVLVVLEPNRSEYEAWMITRLLPFAMGMPGQKGY